MPGIDVFRCARMVSLETFAWCLTYQFECARACESILAVKDLASPVSLKPPVPLAECSVEAAGSSA